MRPLEAFQLIGYATAAALHLWIGLLLLKRRRHLGRVEFVLMPLTLTVGAWHASSLFVALHSMLGLSPARWEPAIRLGDTVAVISVTLTYSLLLHVHLHLWANARKRSLTKTERARVYLSYLPVFFLLYAVPKLWAGQYAPMFEKLSELVFPFALWAAYVLSLVAVTDLLIARLTDSRSEKLLMRTLAAAFLTIAAVILATYGLGLGRGTAARSYVETFANLGSLLPTALLAYHVYRYRYLELIIKESLVVATFAAVVVVAYLYGIRTLGGFVTEHYGLREGVFESILILMLALLASPLRRWLDRRFHRLFEREASLYRDVVASIGRGTGRYKRLPELLRFVEERAVAGLGLRRLRLLIFDSMAKGSDNAPGVHPLRLSSNGNDSRFPGSGESPGFDGPEGVEPRLTAEISRLIEEGDEEAAEHVLLRDYGFAAVLPLRREETTIGLMLVDAGPDALTHDVRAVLEVLAGHVAIAVEDCRLFDQNVRLERKLAQGERLAALGQMAATVAHEVKNPLSAIKSIAQVMREDETLRGEYVRDLDLIVGETDRLSRSVTQMLSFARSLPHTEGEHDAQAIISSVLQLFRGEAANRKIAILKRQDIGNIAIDGDAAAALRDALTNLLRNALQATPEGGEVTVETRLQERALVVSVADTGPGVPVEIRERIWEPFFTTKQRGTGLGLSIVTRRLEEVGGAARLLSSRPGEGSRFEIVVPLG